jgi:hypothetical protein
MLDSRTRARGLMLAAICAGALGLAACGDDDDDTTSPTTTEAEAGELETTETTTDDSGETTEADGDVADVLRSQLQAAGIESSQADCVIDELESSLGEDVLEELQSTEEPSQEVIDASTEAAQKCLTP